MDWECIYTDGVYYLVGNWQEQEVENTKKYILSLPRSNKLCLDLNDVEILSGTAMALLITAVRRILIRHKKLVLINAPQMFAHTLYKTNMLVELDIKLISPREDTGIGR